ncbi:trimeric intracellular cation channel family protein [Sphingomonas sp. ASV193]|uniref:trimeric intracellular cation channel family protein n=1 Tax=Sphingomonas sp. ASV193 TaxID=3144405 RepID=UPI0032E8F535
MALPPTMLPPPILPDALVLLDYVGIAVFAVSGAILAAEKKQTLVTFIFFAVVTGVGGGTMRDLLIGAPVFWVHTNSTLLICIAAAFGVWFLSRHAIADKALLWFDAVGLAAYATYGASKALAYGVAPVPAFAMGVMTACVGGIIRDVLAGEPSILMRPELYVTAAALASGLYVLVAIAGGPALLGALVGGLAGFALRAAAIARGLSLPAYGR